MDYTEESLNKSKEYARNVLEKFFKTPVEDRDTDECRSCLRALFNQAAAVSYIQNTIEPYTEDDLNSFADGTVGDEWLVENDIEKTLKETIECGIQAADHAIDSLEVESEEPTNPEVIVYTDGACSGNPGPGGWGAVILREGRETELSGGYSYTTNGRMEIYAVIHALEALQEPCTVKLYSDSQYVVNAITEGWLKRWSMCGWKKADRKPVKNASLWMLLQKQLEKHKVEAIWVKGHSSNEYNNRCDRLAVLESHKIDLPKDLYKESE